MAKTRKPQKSAPKQKPVAAAVQAAPGAWTVDEAIQAINATSVEEDIAILKRAGILTAEGKLAKLYTSWGDTVSRTPTLSEMKERK
jgi:hypothetical protein